MPILFETGSDKTLLRIRGKRHGLSMICSLLAGVMMLPFCINHKKEGYWLFFPLKQIWSMKFFIFYWTKPRFDLYMIYFFLNKERHWFTVVRLPLLYRVYLIGLDLKGKKNKKTPSLIKTVSFKETQNYNAQRRNLLKERILV